MQLPDVFLSYAHADQEVARQFAETLAGEGLEVWWDDAIRTGQTFDDRIEAALRESKAVVVLWSPRSAQSRWVRAEATLADRNRTLLPVIIEPCERPIMFELIHTPDLSHWDGDTDDRAWRSFMRDLRELTGGQGPAPMSQARAPAKPVARRGGRPSIAVLPFANRSGEKADEAFALGMVEDVIAALSLTPGLKVIARSATAVYRKNASDLRAIGRELGVRYVLEGNVRRVDDDLRVTVQLVEAETGAILWTQKYDRPLKELAYLQEDLVTELAAQLGMEVQRVEMEKALKKPGDLTAWEALIRSWAAYSRFGLESLPVAVAEARKAVEIDPDYALAHATLAMGLGLTHVYFGAKDPAVAREASQHIDRALVIDSNSATVLSLVANACMSLRRWDESLTYAERAVELNPNVANARQVLAFDYLHFNRPKDALVQLEAEQQLAPRGFTSYLSILYRAAAFILMDDLETALKITDQALALAPTYAIALSQKAFLCAMMGRRPEALEAFRRSIALEPGLTRDMLAPRWAVSPFPPEVQKQHLAIILDLWDEINPAPMGKD